jgi:GNAT superfamily N-acetyltransferase
MSDVTVRPYRPDDRSACRALWVELVQHHRELYDDPSIGGPEPGLHFDQHLGRVGPDRVWVAEADGLVLGMTALLVDGEEAEIDPLVVLAKHRGKGIGVALLNHALTEARELRARYRHVRPVARNRKAIAFCHRAGFRLLGRVELFMELQTTGPGTWKPGPELFGLSLDY